ncbi:MAG: amidase family protein [Pyrinomonadaceae bacterium]
MNETLNAFLLNPTGPGPLSELGRLMPTLAVALLARGRLLRSKIIFCVRGLRNTCGSRILFNYHPQYDATVIERLRDVGSVIIEQN